MSKQALCIQREHAPIDFTRMDLQEIPEALFDAPAGLVDREICEEGTDFLQLIPYVVVLDQSGRILCYERGGAGGEDRLHAKLSIGIGGHVDRAQGPGETLEQLLYAEAARELVEEIGVSANLRPFSALIYTGAGGQPVGQVHLGLVTVVEVDATACKYEPGHIEGCRWLSLAELLAPETFDRLENWSQAAAQDLKAAVSLQVGGLMEAFGDVLSELSIESPSGGTASVAHEVATILWGVSHNVRSAVATAQVYDHVEMAERLDELIDFAAAIKYRLGCGQAAE